MLEDIPPLATEWLALRPFALSDADDVRRLAGEAAVAATTLYIPHPYPAGAAEEWIATHAAAATAGMGYTWALTRPAEARDGIMGAITLGVVPQHGRGALGYWLGVPYWNRGYMTEAVRAVVRFGFESLGLHRIKAGVFSRNPASGRVLEKAGFTAEGLLRGCCRKGEAFENVIMYAILRDDAELVNDLH